MLQLEEARTLLARAVETQGRDFVYNPGGAGLCYYQPVVDSEEAADSPRKKTGCVVGVALDLYGTQSHHHEQGSVEDIARADSKLMSDDTLNYLLVAQILQDKGASWGTALDIAEEWAAYEGLDDPDEWLIQRDKAQGVAS